jgi:hypothetical protein
MHLFLWVFIVGRIGRIVEIVDKRAGIADKQQTSPETL